VKSNTPAQPFSIILLKSENMDKEEYKNEMNKDSSKMIKLDEEEINKQQENLLDVPKILFENMIDNTGTSVAEYNKKGFKVLLFFTSYLGCTACQGTLHDIVDLKNQLLLLNVIPIIVHNESQDIYEKWSQENEKTKEFSKELLHLQRTKEIKNHFKLRKSHWLKMATFDFPTNPQFITELKRLASLGIGTFTKYANDETLGILAACYVINDCKVISQYSKDYKFQRFDLARIVIDTNGTGIEVHTDIYSCERPKKVPKEEKEKFQEESPKSETKMKKSFSEFSMGLKRMKEPKSNNSRNTLMAFLSPRFRSNEVEASTDSKPEIPQLSKLSLTEILEDDSKRKFLKSFATREYSVENIIFYEEVMKFQKMDQEERKKKSKLMSDFFFNSDSIYEINTTKKMKDDVELNFEESPAELFDEILRDIVLNTISNTYDRFIFSDLYKEMIEPKKSSKVKYLLFQ
jgi:hypothetical protein